MTISDRDRLDLHEKLSELLGRYHAGLMMELLPHEHDQLATKADLAAVATGLRTEIASVREELHGFAVSVDARLEAQGAQLAGVEARLEAQGAGVEAKLDSQGADIAAIHTRLDQHGAQLDEHTTRLDEHSAHFTAITNRLDEHGTQLTSQGAELAAVTTRLTGVEAKLDAQRTELVGLIELRSSEVSRDLAGISREIASSTRQMTIALVGFGLATWGALLGAGVFT